ncbi:MAG: hypothetical protein KGL11_01080 [Alphaproteobacteria bacterium]|nr:hypothetical protein [Alphaproteobacteria bacterium]
MNKFENMTVQQIAESGQVGAEAWLLGLQTTAQIASAKYMRWSVYAIAVTSGVNALFAFLSWYCPHIPR